MVMLILSLYEYTRAMLTAGLLRLEHNDAIRMGDGQRILEIDSFLLLVYRTDKQEKTKCARAPKYARALLELMAQVHYLLPPKLAYELIWSCCVNHRGHPNSNLPNDLDIEHCNGYFKDEINSYRGEISERAASRVSRSAAMHDTDHQGNMHYQKHSHLMS